MTALVSRLSGRSYRLVALLARGGMGEVFVAREVGPKAPRAPAPVAIKTMLPEVAGDTSMLARFLDEATLSARLSHPNIARLVDFGEAAGRPFAAFELLDGADLGACLDALGQRGKLPPVEVALAVIAEACLGLHHAHTLTRDGTPLQVVHRDLSPSNLFVTRDGRTKVLDFGAATGRFRTTQTAMGMIIGKLQYMAPEQIHGEPLDARTDVFALGLCLYEALTLQPALAAPTEIERVRRVAQGEVPDVAGVRTGLPPGVVAALKRATAARPGERFPSAEALAQALLQELDGLTASPPREILARFHASCFAPARLARRQERLAALMAQEPSLAPLPFDWSAPPLEEDDAGRTLVSAPQAPSPSTRRDRPAEPITDREPAPPQKTPVMPQPVLPLPPTAIRPALPAKAPKPPPPVEPVGAAAPRRWRTPALVAAVLIAAAAVGVALGHAGAALSR